MSNLDRAASGRDQRIAEDDQRAADADFAAGGSAALHRRGVRARKQSGHDRDIASAMRDDSAVARLSEADGAAQIEESVLLSARYGLDPTDAPPMRTDGTGDALRSRAESASRQAQRLESIGRATAGVAHDFGNLLAAVRGFAQLGQRLSADDKAHRYFVEIDSAGQKAGELTRQLSAFAREQELEPVTVDLNEIVEELSSLLHQLLTGDIELVFALSPQPVPVFVDRAQLEQVLVNLVINSEAAIDTLGTITISTTIVDPVRGDHDERVTPTGWLQVSDTGSGISPEVMPHIFDPFFSTKPPETGSGLGLATAYGIVSQSGGDILVDTIVGGGTVMTVALPAHEIA